MESLGIAHKNDESQLRNRFPCLVYHTLTARLIGNHRKAGGKGIATKGGLVNGGIKPSDLGHSNLGLPSGNLTVAIENGHLKWIFPLDMVIFHSYVSLPEGRSNFWVSEHVVWLFYPFFGGGKHGETNDLPMDLGSMT